MEEKGFNSLCKDQACKKNRELGEIQTTVKHIKDAQKELKNNLGGLSDLVREMERKQSISNANYNVLIKKALELNKSNLKQLRVVVSKLAEQDKEDLGLENSIDLLTRSVEAMEKELKETKGTVDKLKNFKLQIMVIGGTISTLIYLFSHLEKIGKWLKGITPPGP